MASFLVDCQARGLSPRTVDFYASELRYLQAYLEMRGILSVQDTSADLLRRYLLDLGQHRNPGGVQAAYGAMRAFFKWYEVEYELDNWSNPIVRVAAPRVPFQALEMSLKDVRVALACPRRSSPTDLALIAAVLMVVTPLTHEQNRAGH